MTFLSEAAGTHRIYNKVISRIARITEFITNYTAIGDFFELKTNELPCFFTSLLLNSNSLPNFLDNYG